MKKTTFYDVANILSASTTDQVASTLRDPLSQSSSVLQHRVDVDQYVSFATFDGDLCVLRSERSRCISVVNLRTGTQLTSLEGHKERMTDLAIKAGICVSLFELVSPTIRGYFLLRQLIEEGKNISSVNRRRK